MGSQIRRYPETSRSLTLLMTSHTATG